LEAVKHNPKQHKGWQVTNPPAFEVLPGQRPTNSRLIRCVDIHQLE